MECKYSSKVKATYTCTKSKVLELYAKFTKEQYMEYACTRFHKSVSNSDSRSFTLCLNGTAISLNRVGDVR